MAALTPARPSRNGLAHPQELVAAVRIVPNGEALLASAVTRSVIEEFARRAPAIEPAPPLPLPT
jgi:hypothetical protein